MPISKEQAQVITETVLNSGNPTIPSRLGVEKNEVKQLLHSVIAATDKTLSNLITPSAPKNAASKENDSSNRNGMGM